MKAGRDLASMPLASGELHRASLSTSVVPSSSHAFSIKRSRAATPRNRWSSGAMMQLNVVSARLKRQQNGGPRMVLQNHVGDGQRRFVRTRW
jgi:hypothetical protein